MQTVSGGNGTTFVPTKPVGLASGDLLIGVFYTDATGTVTMPSGFANLYNINPSGTMHQRVDWKVADSTDAAATNFTWSWSGSVWRVGCLLRVTGAAASSVFENNTSAQNTTSAPNNNTTLPSAALTGVATVDDLALLITSIAVNNAPTWAAPSTWTLQWNSGDDVGIAKQNLASGAGAPTSTHVSVTDTNAGPSAGATIVLAIKSPSGGGGAQTVNPNAIGTAESVFSPTVKLQVQPNAIATAENVYSPTVAQSVLPNAIATAEQVYQPTLTLNVLPGTIGTAEQVYQPSVATGGQVLPNYIPSAEVVFNPTVTQQVLPDTIATGATVYAPTVQLVVSQTVNPNAIGTAEQVYSPVVAFPSTVPPPVGSANQTPAPLSGTSTANYLDWPMLKVELSGDAPPTGVAIGG